MKSGAFCCCWGLLLSVHVYRGVPYAGVLGPTVTQEPLFAVTQSNVFWHSLFASTAIEERIVAVVAAGKATETRLNIGRGDTARCNFWIERCEDIRGDNTCQRRLANGVLKGRRRRRDTSILRGIRIYIHSSPGNAPIWR